MFLAYLHLWSHTLEEVNNVQKYLQKEGISLEKIVHKVKSLKLYLEESREVMILNAIVFATKICDVMYTPIKRRCQRKIKKLLRGEKARDGGLCLQKEVKRSMFEYVDTFCQELSTRKVSAKKIKKIRCFTIF